jgi:hypothetical protein
LDISNNIFLRSDFKNFFSYACSLASLSEEWIDSTNSSRDKVHQNFVDLLKATPEFGLKLIRNAPDGLPKEKFATGIVKALIDLRQAWVPWLESKSTMELPAEARTQILDAQLEVCRKFVEIEPELRRVGLINAMEQPEIQLDDAARLRVRVEGKAFETRGEQVGIAKPAITRRKRKASASKQQRPMTNVEVTTVQVMGRHNGNYHAAANELGKDPKTVRENHKRALKKLNRVDPSSRSVSTQKLPTDYRGQS